MTKEINWNLLNKGPHQGKTSSLREEFAKIHGELRKSQEALSRRKEAEPVLKNELIKAIVDKTPITVKLTIQNPTEALNGISKSEDDDGFYNSSPSANLEAKANAKFEEVMETIPPGTQLIFKSWDKQLRQWIFKSNNGKEYGIYTDSVIIFKGQQIENPGLFGLLFNTSLIDSLGE